MRLCDGEAKQVKEPLLFQMRDDCYVWQVAEAQLAALDAESQQVAQQVQRAAQRLFIQGVEGR